MVLRVAGYDDGDVGRYRLGLRALDGCWASRFLQPEAALTLETRSSYRLLISGCLGYHQHHRHALAADRRAVLSGSSLQ